MLLESCQFIANRGEVILDRIQVGNASLFQEVVRHHPWIHDLPSGAGKQNSGRTRKGNVRLKTILVSAATSSRDSSLRTFGSDAARKPADTARPVAVDADRNRWSVCSRRRLGGSSGAAAGDDNAACARNQSGCGRCCDRGNLRSKAARFYPAALFGSPLGLWLDSDPSRFHQERQGPANPVDGGQPRRRIRGPSRAGKLIRLGPNSVAAGRAGRGLARSKTPLNPGRSGIWQRSPQPA